jgi:hypothetical protein
MYICVFLNICLLNFDFRKIQLAPYLSELSQGVSVEVYR